jgi:HEAT repeat protein
LEETGGKEAAESLREIFKHASDPVVRKAARKALEKIKE